VISLKAVSTGLLLVLSLRLTAQQTPVAHNAHPAAKSPAATKQAKAPAPASAQSTYPTIRYFCFSTDPKQHTVYFSNFFERPDSGSDAENFIAYQLAKDDFQIYLVDKYKYSEDEDLADCAYLSSATANSAATLAAKKRRMVSQATAAKKKVVETGWTGSKPEADKDDDPIGPGGFITPPSQ